MSVHPLTTIRCGMLLCLIFVFNTFASGQEKEESQGVVIERVALDVKPVEEFEVPLQLRPAVVLPIVAPMDGIVADVFVKISDPIRNQAEVFRLDSQERELELKYAQAALEAANVSVEIAADGAEKRKASASVEVAKAALNLAQFRKDQTVIRSSLEGRVIDVNAVKGQFVRTGDLLATVIDPNKLVVELPVERGKVEQGETIDLTVEDQSFTGKVSAILQPLPKFDAIRELFLSVATARVTVDVQGGKPTVGQMVASPMVPRHPVAEIPIAALKTEVNDPDAERSIQVLRQGFVRTLPVQVLGQVGQTHVFVSARFAPHDELIVSSSEELEDGSWVRPMLREEPPKTGSGNQLPAPRSNADF